MVRWNIRHLGTSLELERRWCAEVLVSPQHRQFQRGLAAGGGFVFSAPDAAGGIMDRHLFDRWLSVAERKAGLQKLDGSLWHAYRRKWAIERKHLALKDVAAAGGWKDVNTLLEVYQQPDETSVLAVMSETRKLHERGVA